LFSTYLSNNRRYSKKTRGGTTLKPTATEFAQGLAAAFVTALQKRTTTALDTTAKVDELRVQVNAVQLSALLESNGSLSTFVRPGADLQSSLGATIANSTNGEDLISLSTFVAAFGGDVGLLVFPKTLVTVVDSDDDDDDAWEAAKPPAANDIIDRYNEMTRLQLTRLLKQDEVEFAPETTMDELRRRMRAADTDRVAAEARKAAALEEKRLQDEKKREEREAQEAIDLAERQAQEEKARQAREAQEAIDLAERQVQEEKARQEREAQEAIDLAERQVQEEKARQEREAQAAIQLVEMQLQEEKDRQEREAQEAIELVERQELEEKRRKDKEEQDEIDRTLREQQEEETKLRIESERATGKTNPFANPFAADMANEPPSPAVVEPKEDPYANMGRLACIKLLRTIPQ
jgi:flagellar biosynthesis GTPase FlhF